MKHFDPHNKNKRNSKFFENLMESMFKADTTDKVVPKTSEIVHFNVLLQLIKSDSTPV